MWRPECRVFKRVLPRYAAARRPKQTRFDLLTGDAFPPASGGRRILGRVMDAAVGDETFVRCLGSTLPTFLHVFLSPPTRRR